MRRLENSPSRNYDQNDIYQNKSYRSPNSAKLVRGEIISLTNKLEMIEERIQNAQNSIALYEHDIAAFDKTRLYDSCGHLCSIGLLKKLLIRANTVDSRIELLSGELVASGYERIKTNITETIAQLEEKIDYIIEYEHCINQLYKKEQKLKILRVQRNETILRISIRHL